MSEQLLRIVAPGKDAPGFLKRAKRAMTLQAMVQSEDSGAEGIDAMVAFILDFVEEPKNRALAEELIWEMSQDEFTAALNAIGGRSEDDGPESPLQ